MANYCVLVNGQEVYVEFPRTILLGSSVAEAALKKIGLTTSSVNPQSVTTKVYKLSIEKGEVKKEFIGEVSIYPPVLPLTHAEFSEEMEKILLETPKEFHRFVRNFMEGQFSGYDEILNSARELVFQLKPAILEYTARLKRG